MASLCIPVPIISARAWACGWISDLELMLGPKVPEAVYICTLPNLDAWRAVLPSLVELHHKGASAVILRTDTPAVVRHVRKWGALPTHQDVSGRWRYWASPEIVTRYFGRISQNSRAASGVTISR